MNSPRLCAQLRGNIHSCERKKNYLLQDWFHANKRKKKVCLSQWKWQKTSDLLLKLACLGLLVKLKGEWVVKYLCWLFTINSIHLYTVQVVAYYYRHHHYYYFHSFIIYYYYYYYYYCYYYYHSYHIVINIFYYLLLNYDHHCMIILVSHGVFWYVC